MINRIKPAIFLLIYLLSLQSAYGQLQKNMTDYLKQKFLWYTDNVPREEIFIHSDRDEYIAGEDVWFNIYLIDRQSNKLLESDKIAYIELLNPENNPVIQKRFLIEKGCGPGQIQLPDSLSSGTYTIRAYTNWMKNFLPFNCFIKDIKIYNTLSKKAFRNKIYTDSNSKKGNFIAITLKPDADLILTVNNSRRDVLELTVKTDIRYRIDNSNVFYLFIQTHGIINHISSEKIFSDSAGINISRNELIPGINQITIFDSQGKPICEKYIYTPEKKEQLLSVNSVDSYYKRDKISLNLTLEDVLSTPLNTANLSVSVSPVVANNLESVGARDYMILGSEFNMAPAGTINGEKISRLSPKRVDSMLLTVKSNWIEWEKILNDNLPVRENQVENKYHYLTGKLLTLDQKPPDTAEYLLLSSPDKVATFQYARTDIKGNFSFRIPIDESIRDYIIQLDDATKKHKINIESSFSGKYLKSIVISDLKGKSPPSYISEFSVNYQVNKIYETSFIGDQVIPEIHSKIPKRFYGKPEIELIMADYIKLPVMEEVFFELLPGVSLKERKSVYEISLADPITKKDYDKSPGLMIDGVIINDATIIANTDPETVERIDVVKEKYFIGNYMFYGVINMITKAGDFSSVTLPDYAIRIPYKVLDPVWLFSSPDYSVSGSKDNHIPDFRNTLYWNPSVKTDINGKAKLEFWTSDIISDYEINIQGVTSEGKFISVRKIISVE
jgi:hypothetical protein